MYYWNILYPYLNLEVVYSEVESDGEGVVDEIELKTYGNGGK